MRLQMDPGETRHVKLKICNIKGEPFEITTADYEMIRVYSREVVASGHATILDHVLDVVISPPDHGDYLLKFTYVIGDETLVDVVEVSVP